MNQNGSVAKNNISVKMKKYFFFFPVIQFASFFTKGCDKEQSRIRCAVDSQPLAGFSLGKNGPRIPGGHEFFLL